MSRVIRKLFFGICENIDAVQLRGNHAADRRLCVCYIVAKARNNVVTEPGPQLELPCCRQKEA